MERTITLRQRTNPSVARRVLGLCLLSCLALARPGYAQVWDFVPDVTLTAQNLENPRLAEGTDVDFARTTLDVRLFMSATGQRGEITFEPRVRSERYADSANEELDRDNLYLRANGNYRWQNLSAGFRGIFSRQSILNSEILEAIPEDPDLEDPDEGEAGTLVRFEEDRGRRYFSPYVEFRLSERSGFLVELQLQDVSYSGPETRTRTDYQVNGISAGIVRRVRERNRVSANVFTWKYEAEQIANETNSSGVVGLFTRPLSEIWTLDLAFGVQRTDFSFVEERVVTDPSGFTSIERTVIDNATTTPTYKLSFKRRTDRHTLNFSISRGLAPNASGFVSERDQLWFYTQRRLTSRLSGQIGVRLLETRIIDNLKPNSARKDTRFELEFSWVINRRLYLEFGVNSTTREFPNQPSREVADANSIYVGINYRGLSRTQ